ncbi:hypothetical protein [Paenibacillus polymyxa]|uniref:hypothetical protein n=1 Tax=Paenibacillus polymyxa TaxID=1406 RepID=UPI000845EC5C|nr:hypothetical protein [Paenibacillus polymyxa]AOK91978.1 hypothetical protein AOU00_20445 [Paenibacillus polymyxa]
MNVASEKILPWEIEMFELLSGYPKLPDSAFQGKYHHIKFNWTQFTMRSNDMVEAAYLAIMPFTDSAEREQFAAQYIYRLLEPGYEAAICNFFEAAFGLQGME